MKGIDRRMAELKSRREKLVAQLRIMENHAANKVADVDHSAISRIGMLIDQIDDELACFMRRTQRLTQR